jgi:hypothetical protein
MAELRRDLHVLQLKMLDRQSATVAYGITGASECLRDIPAAPISPGDDAGTLHCKRAEPGFLTQKRSWIVPQANPLQLSQRPPSIQQLDVTQLQSGQPDSGNSAQLDAVSGIEWHQTDQLPAGPSRDRRNLEQSEDRNQKDD